MQGPYLQLGSVACTTVHSLIVLAGVVVRIAEPVIYSPAIFTPDYTPKTECIL